MKIFAFEKDGGKESRVSGLYFIEAKSLFSIVLLHFEDGSREAYHSHAFNALSWVLKGQLTENWLSGWVEHYFPNFAPIFTPRNRFHNVVSKGDTWVLSFRGPWAKTWEEYLPAENRFQTLTHGRKVVS